MGHRGPAFVPWPNRGNDDNPLFQLNNWVESIPRNPDAAEIVNDADTLVEGAELCRERRGQVPNLLAVDYYDRGDVFAASRELNGIEGDVKPETRNSR